MDALLREVTDAGILWFGDFAAVGLEDSTDALHQGGLSGAIVSGKGNALLFSDGKGEIFKDHAWTEFHAEVFDGEHAGGLVQRGGHENQNSMVY